VTIGDGREMLLAGREKYDLIVSEPSNPYRAGIASLFTREYYQAAAKRLNSEGIFAQWIQAYEVDDSTIETVYATFGSVFPNVETWQTQSGDLLLVGTSGPRTYNADELRSRIADEPFRTALLQTWRVTTLEGFLSHFVAGNGFATSIQRLPGVHRNTDDRTVLEFAFARNVDLSSGFRPAALRLMADLMQVNRIPISKGDVNWSDVGVKRLSMLLSLEEMPNPDDYASGIQSTAAAYAAFLKGDLVGALRNWRAHPREPNDLNELLMMAECSANEGTPETDAYLEKLRELLPNEADAIRVSLLLHRGKIDEAAELLATVLQRLHTDPWLSLRLAERTLVLAQRMVDHISNDSQLNAIYEALRTPFSVDMCDALRVNDLVLFGVKLDKGQHGKYTFAAIEPQEPFVPWQVKFLKIREACYKAMKSPLSAQASRDVNDFFAREPSRLSVIRPPTKTTPTETAQPTSAASP
jgi:spermidine synthase